MKQYTTPEQTAKLIELGFKRPRSISSIKVTGNIITTADDLIGEPTSVMGGKITANYSIGELIEMLPKKIEMSDDETGELEVSFGDLCMVYYTSFGVIYYDTEATELIDSLYDMVIKLKEKGIV